MSVLKFPYPSRPISDEFWSVDEIVSQLSQIRAQSSSMREDLHLQGKLPSRKHLESIVERIGYALFPIRLSTRQFTVGNVDYFVGHTLDVTLSELADEAERELQFFCQEDASSTEMHTEAIDRVRKFAATLPEIRRLLETDIMAAYNGDPAARSPDEILACYPGISAMLHHRIAHQLTLNKLPLLARIISELAHAATGIDIHPGAQIDESFFIDHGTGVVIGETAIIGKFVRIYQAVTLGAKSLHSDTRSVPIHGAPRHPIVEDNVVIYAGATILGRITIGRGSIIGGNVWVTDDVAPGQRLTQAKPRSEMFGEGSGI